MFQPKVTETTRKTTTKSRKQFKAERSIKLIAKNMESKAKRKENMQFN